MSFLSKIAGGDKSGGSDAGEALAVRQALNRSQAVIEFDMNGRILWANDIFLKAMGYGLSEIQGQPHRMFVDDAYAATEDYRRFWDELRAGRFMSGEFRRQGRGGREVWIEATYTPVLDRQGRPVKVIKFARDVTDRKLHDLDFEGKMAAIDRSQAVIEFAMDGTILTANANFLAVLGYSLDEIRGKHHSMFVETKERTSPEYRGFWERLNRGEYMTAQYKRIAKGGREIYIQATYNPVIGFDGKPIKVVKFATDVTEQAIRDADYSGQVAAMSRVQAMIEFALDGTILTANDNFLSVMGYSLGEIKGQNHSLFVDAETRASSAYSDFWARLRSGESIAGEIHRVAKGGRDVFLQAHYNSICDLDGKPYKVVKYATDVTSRRVALNRTTELSYSLQELSAAVEEMAVTGKSIAGTMEQTKAAADQATASVSDADASAKQLSQATLAMDGIVDLITNITGQINLLALNATIESARAGEAGRGFAVVATEVKNLANQAKNATSQIASEIAGVRAGSDAVVSALQTIRKTVEDVQDQVMFTASAVEQQSATSQDMARNMQVASTEAENIVRVA